LRSQPPVEHHHVGLTICEAARSSVTHRHGLAAFGLGIHLQAQRQPPGPFGHRLPTGGVRTGRAVAQAARARRVSRDRRRERHGVRRKRRRRGGEGRGPRVMVVHVAQAIFGVHGEAYTIQMRDSSDHGKAIALCRTGRRQGRRHGCTQALLRNCCGDAAVGMRT
jgi:hypothetical protein